VLRELVMSEKRQGALPPMSCGLRFLSLALLLSLPCVCGRTCVGTAVSSARTRAARPHGDAGTAFLTSEAELRRAQHRVQSAVGRRLQVDIATLWATAMAALGIDTVERG